MSKSYREITARITSGAAKIRGEHSEVMKGFSAMAQAATADGALSKKQKELIALAIAVSTRCDGCIGFHAKTCAELGATRQEVMEALGMCVYMGGGPALMYAADAILAYEEFSSPSNSPS
jgi:AhpD family alkylhydroperoxidase